MDVSMQQNMSHYYIAGVVVVEEGRGALTVVLPDGTQAIVHNTITEEPQGAVTKSSASWPCEHVMW